MAYLPAPDLPSSCITHSEPREMLVNFAAVVFIDGISFYPFYEDVLQHPPLHSHYSSVCMHYLSLIRNLI